MIKTTAKHRKARDTWGKPNLAERFLYHTKIGRWYNDFEDASDRAIIKAVVGLGLVAFAVAVYIVAILIF